MRNRINQNGIEVSGVAGTSAVLLSIRLTNDWVDRPDFLGFEILRDDKREDESYPLKRFKYFKETAKKVGDGQLFSTDKHPVQSFFWQDFTVKDDHQYRAGNEDPLHLKTNNSWVERFINWPVNTKQQTIFTEMPL